MCVGLIKTGVGLDAAAAAVSVKVCPIYCCSSGKHAGVTSNGTAVLPKEEGPKVKLSPSRKLYHVQPVHCLCHNATIEAISLRSFVSRTGTCNTFATEFFSLVCLVSPLLSLRRDAPSTSHLSRRGESQSGLFSPLCPSCSTPGVTIQEVPHTLVSLAR